MIRINLQQSAGQGKRRKAASVGGPGHVVPALTLLLPALGAAGGSYYVHQQLVGKIAAVEQATRTAEAEIAKLKPVLDELERFKKDKALLEQKLAAMKSLEGARRGPTRIFAELAAIMPQQVWVTAIREQGMSATLDAIGLDSQSIAVFVNAMQRSPYFANVELTTVEQIQYLGLKVKKFTVTCKFQLPSPPAPPTRTAGAAVPVGADGTVAVR